MRKVSQVEVNRGCMSAYERYRAMSPREAELAYAYEVQGFTKLMLEGGRMTLPQVLAKTGELFALFAKANPEWAKLE